MKKLITDSNLLDALTQFNGKINSKFATISEMNSGLSSKANKTHDHTSISGNAATATALQNARSIAIGNASKNFDGSDNLSFTLSEIGASASGHTHNYAGSSSAGGAATSANKVNTSLTIKLNGGSTEGTNLFTFNGSAAKSINITPDSIGAAASSHGTHVTYSTSAPAANGTASAGSANNVARGDHVHPLQTSVSGNAGTATKLATARDITIGNKTNSFNGTTAISYSLADIGAAPTVHGTHVVYGTCETAAATAEKVVTISGEGFNLVAGQMIAVKFTNTNTAGSVKLNVNETGAYPIWYNASEYTGTGSKYTGYAKRTITYMFNGTHWVWITGGIDDNTTYSNASLGQGYATCDTAESTTAKVGTLSSYALTTGGVVSVKFTYAVPASATLNINSKGAKAIYFRGTAITANIIKAGDIATFIYNGSQYQLIAIDRWQNDLTSHTHDDRYFTESEINTKINTINTSISTAQTNAVNSAKSYTDTAITNLVNSAPDAMNTLKELADAIDAHQDVYEAYVDEVSTALAGKADKSHGTHLTLGTGSGNAFRGDYGNTAYNHSQAAHAPSDAQKNQNAFSNVTVGSTTIAADSATDTLTIVAGTNITLTPDATNDKLTIAATDTVYTHPTSGVTAGSYGNSSAQTPAYGATFNVPYITVNAQGHVTGISNQTVKIPASDNSDTKVKSTLSTTTKFHLTGTTATATTTGEQYFDTGIYVSATAGELVATKFTGALNGNANSASKVNNNLVIKLDSGTTEGTDMFTFNGSAAKTVNLQCATEDEIAALIDTVWGA